MMTHLERANQCIDSLVVPLYLDDTLVFGEHQLDEGLSQIRLDER
jgi:hypothetical protein